MEDEPIKNSLYGWTRLNNFMPAGKRVVDAYIDYRDDLEGCGSFDDYMQRNYGEALLVYRAARRVTS